MRTSKKQTHRRDACATIQIFNRQKTRAIDLILLRKISGCLLNELLGEKSFELGIHLIAAPEMAQVNEKFLQHHGSTDVVTFDYSEDQRASGVPPERAAGHPLSSMPAGRRQQVALHGEIFLSVDDAVSQSRQFRTTWPSELVRYIVHGILHLRGYDDLQPALRRKMKREENRLLKELSLRFALGKLHRATKTL